MQFLPSLRSALLLTGASLLLGSSAIAQLPCLFGDDGFGGACCDPAASNLPDFPAFVEEGSYACLTSCDDLSTFDVVVEASEIQFFQCDLGLMDLSISPAGFGAPGFRGTVVAKYIRTWRSLPNGNQVWRFSLNGNFEYDTSVGAFGCPNPLSPSEPYFIGHIDYTCGLGFSDVRVALNLNYLPACITNGPLSSNPGGGGPLPEASYHLVAPAQFAWMTASDLQGTGTNDAMRDSRMAQCFNTYGCLGETRFEEAKIATNFQDCLCVGGQGRWFHQSAKGIGECGNQAFFETINNLDPGVPTGLVSLPLGTWTQPGWLEGVELSTYYGYFQDESACPSFQAAFEPQFVTGVSTVGYEGVIINSGDTEKAFLDFSNHMLPDFSGGCFGLTPGFGGLSLSTKVWSMNPQL